MRQKLTDQQPTVGTLQSYGELAVLAEQEEPTRHRYAMVIAFDNEAQLREALSNRCLNYRVGITAQELIHE